MATRADFYIQDKKGELEFLGSTVNDYDGDFEDSKTVSEFRQNVLDKLKLNNSVSGKWYWPWDNSVVTDEVFIFKHTPSFFNKDKGVLYTKTYFKGRDCNSNILGVCLYKNRYHESQDDSGYLPDSMIKFIEVPNLKHLS